MHRNDHDSRSTTCPNCGKNNDCKMDASCWCMSKPRTGVVPKEGACLCEHCFDKQNSLLGFLQPERGDSGAGQP